MKRAELCWLILPLFILALVRYSSSSCEFAYRNETNNVCTRIVTTAFVQIQYFDKQNKVKPATIRVPCKSNDSLAVNVSGSCNQPTKDKNILMNLLEVSWNDDSNGTYYMEFNITKNIKQKQWTLDSVALLIEDVQLDKILIDFEANASTTFTGDLDYKQSYKCHHNRTVKFNIYNEQSHPTTKYNASLIVGEFQLQAFEFKNNTSGDFGSAMDCSLDINIVLVVSTAAGAAVVLMIAVMLVAFVVGKLRNRKKGGANYEEIK